jgi:hypothetical protein
MRLDGHPNVRLAALSQQSIQSSLARFSESCCGLTMALLHFGNFPNPWRRVSVIHVDSASRISRLCANR